MSEGKISKTKAKYLTPFASARLGRNRCYECDMFRAPDRCTLVRGDIDPQATCKFWERKK